MNGILVIVCLLGLAVTGLWLWSLIHCINNRRLSDSNRTLGIILIVILGLIGSLIYLGLPRQAPSTRRHGVNGRSTGGRTTGSRATGSRTTGSRATGTLRRSSKPGLRSTRSTPTKVTTRRLSHARR